MISELHLPWMELSILILLFGAIWIRMTHDRDTAYRRCLLICGLVFLTTVCEWIDFESLNTFEARDHFNIFDWVFNNDFFIIDELSAPLLPLAALLYLLTVLSTLKTKGHRFPFSSALLSEAILLATLSCKEPWGIIALLSVATILPYLEIKAHHLSTRVYVLHMGLFIALLVVGGALSHFGEAGDSISLTAGALLTTAALLRSGIIPLHCWMTDLFEKVTFGTALLFVTPMTGAYAMVRLVFPIAPDWALQGIALVSLTTAVYAAGMALVQREARRFFCYLFLSHSSLVLVGLEMATPLGLTGGLCVWISVGISLAGFALTFRSIEARIGRISLVKYHGLYDHTPTLAALFLVTGLASIGFPGTVGFIGTELLIEGAIEVYPLVGTAVVIAAALNSIAILQAYFRVFTGARHTATISLRARTSEHVAILILVALILGGGLYPQPGVTSRQHAAMELIRLRGAVLNDSTHPSDPNIGVTDLTETSQPLMKLHEDQ
ncbi:proton-conducting transporter transmembrane domain-containing protein [Gimesia fumaroli]|uniref:NADH-quinone oxidoreductase subunit M n=1 Tax=Gimesia fumaroli TaxID=2527976 RepID=A0A518IFM9_9PLAN|nr:proton-conducting transporter membrane subunit [Gimesia fumaroli]QDV51886.1 NADH-quinone oxidoreductase subunit M [Gimesia fumaroli]